MTPAPMPEASWEQQLLSLLGAPLTQPNIAFLDAWNKHEGNVGGQSGLGINNPFNTTNSGPGSFPVNSKGVQWFPTLSEGLQYTAKTIKPQNQAGWTDYFPDIYKALLSGDPFANATDAVKAQLNVWGTGSGWLNTPETGTGPTLPPGGNPTRPPEGGSPAATPKGSCSRPNEFIFEPYPNGKGTNLGAWLGYWGCLGSYWLGRIGFAIAAAGLVIVGIWLYSLDKDAPGVEGLKQAGKKLPRPAIAKAATAAAPQSKHVDLENMEKRAQAHRDAADIGVRLRGSSVNKHAGSIW